MLRHAAVLAFVTILAGCDFTKLDPGGGAVAPAVVNLRSVELDAKPPVCGFCDPQPDRPPGKLAGRIFLEGQFSALPALIAHEGAVVDPTVCASGTAIPDQSLLVGADGGITNVFVYLSDPPAGWDPVNYVKPEEVVLDQLGCIFTPHASIWPTGVSIVIRNSDPISHNVAIATNSNQSWGTTSPPRSEDRLK